MNTKLICIVLFCGIVSSCAVPPKINQSQMQIQAYQSHEFETTKRIAFDATMSILQDAGFIIESADYETGFITGKGTTQSRLDFWWGAMNEHIRVTAFIEQRTSLLARVRLNLVESSQRKSVWNLAQDVINEVSVRDPQAYQLLFEKIGQAIFVKKNL